MKLNCEFILREVAGETILVPVGQTALRFNGIITLDPVGATIWQCLQSCKSREEILDQILGEFEVDRQTADGDLDDFLDQLRKKGFLE